MNIKIGAVSSIVNLFAVLGFAALRELLFGYGVMELEIFLSEEPPKQHPISGK